MNKKTYKLRATDPNTQEIFYFRIKCPADKDYSLDDVVELYEKIRGEWYDEDYPDYLINYLADRFLNEYNIKFEEVWMKADTEVDF